MASKKELMENELMREIIPIRIDTLWKMLPLQKTGNLPPIDMEQASGDLDDKGAIFVPGNLILKDSDKRAIQREPYESLPTASMFRELIRESMKYDGAVLLYHDGFAYGVELDNGFFAEVASNILGSKKDARRRSEKFTEHPPEEIYSENIAYSYCPKYVEKPYGTRTKVTACVAACSVHPRLYFRECKRFYGLEENAVEVWDNLKQAAKPILGRGGIVLAQPHVVICHKTRHHQKNLTGITRILGFGEFGEFANFTLEELTTNLMNELQIDSDKVTQEDLVAEYDQRRFVAILRIYPKTEPGKRAARVEKYLVSPTRDLHLDLKTVEAEAKERYKIS